MQRFSFLSGHADLRVEQRTALGPHEITEQIDRKVYLSLGMVPGFNKEHVLLYSAPDDACFVVVRDRICGTVITVLPLNYHDAWPVSAAQCAQAKGLYEADMLAREDERLRLLARVAPPPSVIVVSASVLDEQGVSYHRKTMQLFKRPAQDYDHCVGALLRDASLMDEVVQAVNERGYPTRSLYSVTARLGKRGVCVSAFVEHSNGQVYLDLRRVPEEILPAAPGVAHAPSSVSSVAVSRPVVEAGEAEAGRSVARAPAVAI